MSVKEYDVLVATWGGGQGRGTEHGPFVRI